MEVASEEHLTKGSESAPVTDGKDNSVMCNHFTIRGYVADVRKRDTKICWPLFMPYNENSDIHANMLPPLLVSKFKRWSCMNCLHTISTSIDATRIPDLSDVENKEIKTKDSLFLLNRNAKRFFSSSKKFSENITPGERLVSGSSNNIRHCNCSPDLCHGKKENGSIIEDVAGKGLRICLCGNFSSEENQDLLCKPTSAVAGDEFQAEKKQIEKQTVGKNNCEIAFHDASPLVCGKPDGHASIGASSKYKVGICTQQKMNVMPDGTAKESRRMVGVDLGALEDDALITAVNTVNDDLLGLEHSNDEALYRNMDLLVCTNHRNPNSEFSYSYGKMNQKRVRKLRFLDDIMKGEEIHKPKKIHISKENAEASQVKNTHDGSSNVSKSEAELLDCSSNHVIKHSELVHMHPSDDIEAIQNKDDEISLMHWLKKMSKKLVIDDSRKKKIVIAKEYPEIKGREKKVGDQKDVDACIQASKVSKHNKMNTVEKENKVSQLKPSGDCFISQQENICKDTMMKHVLPGNVFPKMRSINSASILLPFIGHLDKVSQKKARGKKKVSQLDNRNSPKINCSRKKMVKKRRTTEAHEKGTPDDIPMDIVELLAKNQHERNLMNAGISCKKPMTPGVVRNANDSSVSRYCGKEVSHAIYRNHSISNNPGYVDSTAYCGNQNSDCEACKSMECRKHIFIDLNQRATDFLTISKFDRPQPRTTDLPVLDPKKMHSLQNSSGDRLWLQDFESFQCRGISAPILSGDSLCVLSSPFEGRKFAVNNRNVDAYSNYVKMIPHDSAFDGMQRTVTREIESLPLAPTSSLFLNSGEKSGQSIDKTTLADRQYLTEVRSRFHPGRTLPPDLHANETVSALHLLRLVDQAALSGASPSWNINCTGKNHDSILHQSTRMLGVKSKIMATPENPLAAVYSACDQNGRFSKPHRPVPRIGALGSLLQKEIMSQPNIALLGSKCTYSDQLPSFWKDRVEYSDPSLAIKTGYGEGGHSVTISSKQNVNAGDSFVYKFKTGSIVTSEKDELGQSGRHDNVSLPCVVNRNPADFSLPDEDNIYMRGGENQSSKSTFLCCQIDNTFMPRSSSYENHDVRKKWQVKVMRNGYA